MDMCNCLKTPTSQFRKLFSIVFVFISLCASAQAATYYWVGKGVDNNWKTSKNWDTDPSGDGLDDIYPGSNTNGNTDIAYIIDDSIINLNSETDFYVGTIRIANNNKTAELQLNFDSENELNIGTFNLGTETSHEIAETKGNLIISSSGTNTNVTISEFDTGNHGNNYIYLDNINCKVEDTFWVDSNGYDTTIDGSNQSTFSHPSGSGGTSTITFGEEIIPEEIIKNEGINVSTTGNPRPGAEITISLNNQTTIYYEATITGSESYSIEIDSNPATTLNSSITPITSGEHNIKITFPSSIAQNNGLSFSLYKSSTVNDETFFGTLISYTQTLNETVWTGTDNTDWNTAANWTNGVPTAGMQVSIPQVTGDNYPVISNNTAGNLVLTIAADASLTVGTGGTLNAKSIRNNGTLTVSSGSVNSTTLTNNEAVNLSSGSISSSTFTNNETITISGGTITSSQKISSSASKIVYNATGTQTLVWGNNYQNLEIAEGTSVTFNAATTISGKATNNGTLTIGTNSFSTGSIENGESSTIIYDGVTSPIWGESYQNLIIKNGTAISLGVVSISGTVTNNGTLTITSDSFSAATKDNGTTNSTIIYSGVTSPVWGTEYKNLEISTETNISLGAVSISGTVTNNGTLTITSNSFSAGNTVNSTGSTIIYNGVSSPVWGTEYKKLKITSGTLTLNDITVDESLTNNSTVTIQGTTSLSGTATNNGTIKFGTVTLSGTPTFVNGDTSTIIYDGTTSLIWGADYENLIVESGGLTLSADSTINASSIIIDGAVSNPSKALTLNSSVINLNNDITTGNLTIPRGAVTVTGIRTLNGTQINFGNEATINGSAELSLLGTVIISANVGEVSQLTSLTVSGPLQINCERITTTGDQTYNDSVTISHNSKLTAGSTQLIKFLSTVSGTSGTETLEIVTGNSEFNGQITNLANLKTDALATFNENVTIGTLQAQNTKINCSQISTTADQTYNGNVQLDKAVTLTAANDVTFNQAVTGTADNVTLTINANTVVNTDTISTKNNQTYNGTVTLKKNGDITLSAKNTANEYQTIQLRGNLSCADSVNSNLIFDANVNINCSTVTTPGTQTYNGIVQINNVSATISASEIDFKKDINGNEKKLIINSPIFKSIADTGNSSSITLSELEFSQDTSIQYANTSTSAINLTVPKISGTGKTVTLAALSELSFNGDVEFNPNITTVIGSHFKASTGTMTFKADINFADNTFAANNGTIKLIPATTSVSISGNNTFYNFTAGEETTGLGGKTITFQANSTQKVTGTLKLNGTSETSRLKLRSSAPTTEATDGTPWIIKCTAASNVSHQIKYIDVQDSNNISNTSPTDDPSYAYNLFAISSNDSGKNTKWSFPGMLYKWNGSASSSWNTDKNWTPASIPGKGSNITIEAVTSPASTLLLESELDLTAEYNGTDYSGTITVNSGAVFDLAGNNLKVGTITNNGLVRLIGASITAAMNNGANSTVEYYGTGTAISNFAWDGDNGTDSLGKQYANLLITRAIIQNTDEANKLQVSGTTTIMAESSNTVSLNNAYNIFTGHVILGNQSTSTSAGIVTLNGSSNGSTAIYLSDSTLADNLILNSNVQGGVLTFATPLTVNTEQVSSTGPQTYNNPVTITHNANFVSESGNLIHFKAPITGSGSESLTVSTADSRFDGAVTNLSSLTADATATFNAEITTGTLTTHAANLNNTTITTTGNQNYNGAVTLGNASMLTLTADNINFNETLDGTHELTLSIPDNIEKIISVNGKVGENGTPSITIAQGGTVSFNDTVKASSLEITKANNTTFNDQISLGSFTDTENAGNLIFKNGGVISDSTGTTFLTTGTLTFGDSQTDVITFGTDSTRADFIHTAGNTVTSGTINAASIQTGNVTIENNTTINTSSTQTFNGTINDTTEGEHTLNLNSSSGQITFTESIGLSIPLKDFTVTGLAAINCNSITTTGVQTYNAPVTGSASITLNAAKLNLNCSTVNTVGSQSYNAVTELLSNTSFTSSTGNIHFTSTVNTEHTFKITKSNNTIFDDVVQITDFKDTATAGNIAFKNGGIISNTEGTIFLTTGTVSFGDASTDTMSFGNASPYSNLTHTAGPTNITGLINTANITLGQTTCGPTTIANSGLLKTTDGSAINFTDSFTQNGAGNSYLGGSFTGTGNAEFATNVQLSGNSAADFGTANTNININKNLIIIRGSDLNINSSIQINENLILYNGQVIANADISVNKDILINGSLYKTKDETTGIEDEFAYTTPRHSNWSQPNYNEASLPDGSALPLTSSYSGTLSVAAEKTISAGKNFYANGTTLSTAGSSGQWNLKLPDITNPANGFAEAYHSVVSGCKVICNDGSSNGSKARLTALECTDLGVGSATLNTNVEFEDFKITAAYTVRDNAIRVEFNQPIRYHTSTINSLNFHEANNTVSASTRFTGFYSDPDCQNELTSDITLSYTDEDEKTYYYFYIKAEPQDSATTGAWNTDATGRSSGGSDAHSSDRDGIHHTAIPCLDFPRSLITADGATLSFILTDRWGKRLNNYSRRPSATASEPAYGSTASTYDVADKTGPVLWTVRTGQELHTPYLASTGEASQHSYDAHNFLEFRYSEPVEFYEAGTQQIITENFKVTDLLGAISEDITQAHNTLTFAGITKLTAQAGSSLKLHTGTNGTASKYMNALYRPDNYSLRLSIAGWTDGTIADYAGNIYKKWPGYIESSTQFTNAKATYLEENTVKDLNGNCQIEYTSECKIEPTVLSSSDGTYSTGLLPVTPDIYSEWDISSPYFAPLRSTSDVTSITTDNLWSETNERSEAIGNTNGTGSTLDRIDFHFFDNTPAFDNTDEAEWFTEIGWCIPGSSGSRSNLKDSSYTYTADIVGGARQFDTNASRRTSGGIRLSTKLSVASGFKYSSEQAENPNTPFATGLNQVHSTVVSKLFTGSATPQHLANDPDGLYLGLGITDTGLPVETTFSFSYDDSKAYLTDLAGNRLRNKISKTIDRTPPSFDIILSPINQNKIYIVFVKKLETSLNSIRIFNEEGKTPSEVYPTGDFLSLLPDCFQLIKISSTGSYEPADENDIAIDTTVPARIIEKYSDTHFTCICLQTTRNITYEDLCTLHIQLKNHKDWPVESQDIFTSNTNARVTFIQDTAHNYMTMSSAHALSDFAINYINPLYAYSTDISIEDTPVMNGLYENGSWAVHNWNADQNKYGTLPAEYSAAIVAEAAGEDIPNIRMYLSNSPDRDSVSTQFNKDFKNALHPPLRVWLPDLTDGIFRALTATNNSNFTYLDSETLTQEQSGNLIFNIPKEMINTWKSGDQISFMFGITHDDGTPVKIYNNPYFDIENNKYDFSHNIAVPLYSLRMQDATDIGTLDLWSFRLKGITNQRGSVTILNNVINAGKGEKTVIKVDVPSDEKLNVIVMTLDGNIITYLHRGNSKAGETYFTWDGKNRNGSTVARGMYFIRVVGTDFDETRKVMVIND